MRSCLKGDGLERGWDHGLGGINIIVSSIDDISEVDVGRTIMSANLNLSLDVLANRSRGYFHLGPTP